MVQTALTRVTRAVERQIAEQKVGEVQFEDIDPLLAENAEEAVSPSTRAVNSVEALLREISL